MMAQPIQKWKVTNDRKVLTSHREVLSSLTSFMCCRHDIINFTEEKIEIISPKITVFLLKTKGNASKVG